jgi:formate hydrogenlyase subunit 6/NADH:ubiquinone oxidoreductase subunit I
MWFESFHVLKHTKSMDASNYLIQTNPETCKACGLCVKRCPMEALRLDDSDQARNKKGKAAIPDTTLCIGCGVCVHKCPTHSLKLVHRGEVNDPPADPRSHVKRFFMDRQSG